MSDYLSTLEALLDDLVDAAIEADMYERDYWAQSGSSVFYNHMLFKEVHRGHPELNDMGDTDDTTDYEAVVFNHWPGQIAQVFDVWKNIPDPDDFSADYDRLIGLARENEMEPKIKAPQELGAEKFPKLPDNEFGSDLRQVTERTLGLSGSWIESFHDNYVLPLPWVLANQQALVAILAAGVKSEAEVWRRTQKAVLELAEAGATWFRSLKNDGPSAMATVLAVGGAVNDGFSAVKSGISLNPFEVIGAVEDLVGAGKDLAGAIGDVPTPPDRSHSFGSVASVYTGIAQNLEYTICRDITAEEQLLQDALNAGVDALTASPGTFVMNNERTLDVANGARVLSREQYLHRGTVNRTVAAMRGVATSVTRVGNRIDTSAMPWLRPAGIGLSTQGPYPAFLALENATRDAFHDTGQNLAHVAGIVATAADYAFASDEEAQATLRRVNDRLERFNDEQDQLPDAPVPHVAEPHTVPNGTVYQDQDDCEPPTDPFTDDPFGNDAPLGPVLPAS